MTSPAPHDVQATFCATLVDEWARAGVAHAVVAPGSRSTPLALALAADDRIAVHVFHDERAAGFCAVGIGRATGVPAVVLTTSGTATAELHAAVVEADLGAVPMVVCTADRPPELHHVGAPQTVDQQHLYGRAARWFADPGVADHRTRASWRSLASRAVAEATTGAAGPGPVQLNLPFREPLVGTAGPLPDGRDGGRPWHGTGRRRRELDADGLDDLWQVVRAERGIIVAGDGAGEPSEVLALGRALGWPVLADPASGCRVALADEVVGAFDLILRHADVAATLAPDAVLHLGGRPASKALARWLATCEPVEVVVAGRVRWLDPGRRAAYVLDVDPTEACRAMARAVRGEPVDPAWRSAWAAAEAAAQGAIEGVLAGHPEPTEPGIARSLVAGLPLGATLVVSSSMPVRDVEWCSAPRDRLRVVANRGANGIDGVVATAIGAALAGDPRPLAAAGPTAALVGDVAFLHDGTALIGLAERGIDLVVVVVDNDGGGIFSFLPQASELDAERFEQLFGTPHGVDLAALAAAHGLPVAEPGTAAEVVEAIDAAVAAGGVQVVRVRTERAANAAIHDELVAAVGAALDRRGDLPDR